MSLRVMMMAMLQVLGEHHKDRAEERAARSDAKVTDNVTPYVTIFIAGLVSKTSPRNRKC